MWRRRHAQTILKETNNLKKKLAELPKHQSFLKYVPLTHNFIVVNLAYGYSETKNICIKLLMISLITYTANNLNAYHKG